MGSNVVVKESGKRFGRMKKWLGIFFLALSMVCLISGMAFANPSSGEVSNPMPKLALVDTAIPQQKAVEPGKQALLSHQKVEGSRGTERPPQEVSLRTTGTDREETVRLVPSHFVSRVDAPGYKTRVHMFMASRRHPGPALLLIEERSSNGEVYLGLLSFAIPW